MILTSYDGIIKAQSQGSLITDRSLTLYRNLEITRSKNINSTYSIKVHNHFIGNAHINIIGEEFHAIKHRTEFELGNQIHYPCFRTRRYF